MKLVITQNITLDGVIDAAAGWFSPEGDDGDDLSDIEAELQRQMHAEDGFLVGRRTFEEMRGYWPNQTGDTTGITKHLNSVTKYVVSSTLGDPEWENTTVLTGDPVDEVRTVKEQPGNEVGVTGSITLCHALIEAGIVDEFRLFVYPVVLGRGRRLFPDGVDVGTLALVGATPFRSGVVLLTYRPTGQETT